ncbi:hypothetical protein [Zavarzinella formosa]|uniref:hypothetical protein n=1 Tax=Zavarzinella formosa TaxID=360055 RepID=UPI0002DF3714|nr:hypothetical protein [Zavarzinella formosa]
MRNLSRTARHLAGYALITLMVLREQIDWTTLALACLVILVFDLPGVRWLKARLYDLARQWIARDPR